VAIRCPSDLITLSAFRAWIWPAALSTGAVLGVFAPSAGAINLPPGQLINDPAYCMALYGDPSPCPLPDRPKPVDKHCLRVDVAPVDCPYQP
jgi:hypothetical protein